MEILRRIELPLLRLRSKNNIDSASPELISLTMKILRRIELPLLRLRSKVKKEGKKRKKIERGLVPVLVGEEGKELKRLEVPISCLSSKAFEQLLEEYEDYIGAVREGPIQLPCSLDLFERVLSISCVEDHNGARQYAWLSHACLSKIRCV